MTSERVDLRQYIVISIWHGCNNDCSICMLSEVRNRMPAVELDQYRKYVDEIVRKGFYRNLILSGAEVTTLESLEEYVRYAAGTGFFHKIQIQTNGRRLKDRDYLAGLVEAGVNEFFVSVHGLEETHDAITRRPGSFAETMEGFDNLEGFEVNVIPNTVLTRQNLDEAACLMEHLCRRSVSEVHMWNFYPMEDRDTGEQVVSMDELIDLLGGLWPTFREAGKPLVLKSFPECLSIGNPVIFDSGYPATLLPEVFWKKFHESGFGTCVHRDRCQARECWGLSKAYIRKYGDERDLLSPLAAKQSRVQCSGFREEK